MSPQAKRLTRNGNHPTHRHLAVRANLVASGETPYEERKLGLNTACLYLLGATGRLRRNQRICNVIVCNNNRYLLGATGRLRRNALRGTETPYPQRAYSTGGFQGRLRRNALRGTETSNPLAGIPLTSAGVASGETPYEERKRLRLHPHGSEVFHVASGETPYEERKHFSFTNCGKRPSSESPQAKRLTRNGNRWIANFYLYLHCSSPQAKRLTRNGNRNRRCVVALGTGNVASGETPHEERKQ